MRVAPKKEGAGELNTRVYLEVASLHRYDFAFCARRRRETITAHHNDLHAPVPTATTCHGYTFLPPCFPPTSLTLLVGRIFGIIRGALEAGGAESRRLLCCCSSSASRCATRSSAAEDMESSTSRPSSRPEMACSIKKCESSSGTHRFSSPNVVSIMETRHKTNAIEAGSGDWTSASLQCKRENIAAAFIQ